MPWSDEWARTRFSVKLMEAFDKATYVGRCDSELVSLSSNARPMNSET